MGVDTEEDFIKHLVTIYSEELPPIWACCEVMSLGLLSKWYKNFSETHTKNLISCVYTFKADIFESWLQHLSVVRNVCAHHSRLWNRDFNRIYPKIPKSKPAALVGEFERTTKLYNSIIVMLFLMDKIEPEHTWRERLKSLLSENENLLSHMGFPEDWQTRPIWIDS